MKKKHIKFLSALFMVLPMSVVMAFVGVLRIYGFSSQWYLNFIKSWSIMFPVAYCSAIVFAPIAQKITKIFERKTEN